MKIFIFLLLVLLLNAKERERYYTSPDAVENLIKSQNSFSLKETLKREFGLSLGADYHLLGFRASSSFGSRNSSSEVIRVFGEWKKEQNSSGSLVFKIEHRLSFTKLSPVDFSTDLGYAGLVQSTYSNQKLRLTHLYWKQNFKEEEATIFAGFLDVSDYVDTYLLISPWDGFGNMVFATGSATIGGLPDGALGVMGAKWLNSRVYIVGSFADATADASNPLSGSIKNKKFFKSFEIGFVPAKERLYFDNFHITLWHIDKTKNSKKGYGLSFSLTHTFNDYMLGFLRGGWSKDGGALLSKSLSGGFGYKIGNDVIGFGLNWGIPNKELYGLSHPQWTSEIFYRYQVGKNIQITPSCQILINPALNLKKDAIALMGLRFEVKF